MAGKAARMRNQVDWRRDDKEDESVRRKIRNVAGGRLMILLGFSKAFGRGEGSGCPCVNSRCEKLPAHTPGLQLAAHSRTHLVLLPIWCCLSPISLSSGKTLTVTATLRLQDSGEIKTSVASIRFYTLVSSTTSRPGHAHAHAHQLCGLCTGRVLIVFHFNCATSSIIIKRCSSRWGAS